MTCWRAVNFPARGRSSGATSGASSLRNCIFWVSRCAGKRPRSSTSRRISISLQQPQRWPVALRSAGPVGPGHAGCRSLSWPLRANPAASPGAEVFSQATPLHQLLRSLSNPPIAALETLELPGEPPPASPLTRSLWARASPARGLPGHPARHGIARGNSGPDRHHHQASRHRPADVGRCARSQKPAECDGAATGSFEGAIRRGRRKGTTAGGNPGGGNSPARSGGENLSGFHPARGDPSRRRGDGAPGTRGLCPGRAAGAKEQRATDLRGQRLNPAATRRSRPLQASSAEFGPEWMPGHASGRRVDDHPSLPADAVELEIRDSGVGIPPDAQKRFFSLFTLPSPAALALDLPWRFAWCRG